MNCQCQGIEELFSDQVVEKELAHYRKKGPARTTRLLIEALLSEGVSGAHLLDIGGGLGAIQHALLSAGARSAVDVDASQAYIRAARQEAARRGLDSRAEFRHGDFVTLADQVSPADVVTLDRVLCCYDDMHALVRRSAERAGRLYGLVYPRDAWWVRAAAVLMNLYFRLTGNPYRSFIHPSDEVERLVRGSGLRRIFHRQTAAWQVAVYARA